MSVLTNFCLKTSAIDRYEIVDFYQLLTTILTCFALGGIVGFWTSRKNIFGSAKILKASFNETSSADQSHKMAALGKLAGDVAHEVNNPLTVILCLADEIESATAGEEKDFAKSKAKKIKDMVWRSSKTLQSVVKIAKDNKNRQSMKRSYALDTIVEDTVNLLRPRAKSKDIFLKVDLPTERDFHFVCSLSDISIMMIDILATCIDRLSSGDEKWIELKLRRSHNDLTMSVSTSPLSSPLQDADEFYSFEFCRRIVADHGGTLKLESDEENHKSILLISLPPSTASAVPIAS